MKFKLPISQKDHEVLLKKYGKDGLDRLMDKYNIELVILEPKKQGRES